MQPKGSFLSSLALAAVFAVPFITAVPSLQAQAVVQVRVYDRYHRDYHVWDEREDGYYRGYLVERHHEYRVYQRQPSAEQRRYWIWRHEREAREARERDHR